MIGGCLWIVRCIVFSGNFHRTTILAQGDGDYQLQARIKVSLKNKNNHIININIPIEANYSERYVHKWFDSLRGV